MGIRMYLSIAIACVNCVCPAGCSLPALPIGQAPSLPTSHIAIAIASPRITSNKVAWRRPWAVSQPGPVSNYRFAFQSFEIDRRARDPSSSRAIRFGHQVDTLDTHYCPSSPPSRGSTPHS